MVDDGVRPRADGGTERLAEAPIAAIAGEWDALADAVAAAPWADYRRTIAKRARSIEREIRRLGRRQGSVGVVDIRGGPDLDRYIDIGFDLESSGWKRRDGTAIVSRRDTAAFYRELCHWAAA